MISRRQFSAGLCACALAGCTAHQSGPADVASLKPGFRPDPKTDEAGLWLAIEKLEREARASHLRIRDEGINALVSDILCRLSGDYCPDLRPYVMRIPSMNASMYPNGMTHVQTGLLLRCRNESQLAAVLGHEFGHYLRRHTLAAMRNSRETWDMLAVMSLGLAAAGGSPGLNDFNRLIVALQLQAYSRDHEREADAIGLELMAKAGYDPTQAPAMWRQVIDLDKAAEEERRFSLLDTHPDPGERVENLERQAKTLPSSGAPAPDRLAAAIAPIRGLMLADEINMGTFKRSQRLLDLMLEGDSRPGEILYYKGELFRRRAKPGDDDIALGLYHEASEKPGSPPEALRNVGLGRWRQGRKDEARDYLRRYLNARPDAPDAPLILNYVGSV